MNNNTTEVSFVTKKMLVSFNNPVAIMVEGIPIFTHTAVCEYQEQTNASTYKNDGFPSTLTIVALTDRNLTRSIRVQVGFNTIGSMSEL